MGGERKGRQRGPGMYDGCVLVEDRGHQSNRKLAIFPHFVMSPLSRFVGTRTLGDLPLLSSWQNKSRKKRTECRRMQHSCEEREAEGAASVGATIVNVVGRRFGWEFGWRREDSKVSEEELVRR